MFIKTIPGEPVQLRAAQIRGARALLGLSPFELASAAGVSVSAILRLERAGAALPPAAASQAIRGALEARGIRFLGDGPESFGVLFEAGMSRSRAGEF